MSGQILALGSTPCIVQSCLGSWQTPPCFLQGDTGLEAFSICSFYLTFSEAILIPALSKSNDK